jgi:hypothetical protein
MGNVRLKATRDRVATGVITSGAARWGGRILDHPGNSRQWHPFAKFSRLRVGNEGVRRLAERFARSGLQRDFFSTNSVAPDVQSPFHVSAAKSRRKNRMEPFVILEMPDGAQFQWDGLNWRGEDPNVITLLDQLSDNYPRARHESERVWIERILGMWPLGRNALVTINLDEEEAMNREDFREGDEVAVGLLR